ncbi:MAG TPA: amidase [Burkholderiaceae bacterium]|nr:amidase [Burkholderiaceae bacterium]
MHGLSTVTSLQQQLRQGRVTSEYLVRQALDQIADTTGQGKFAFIRVFADQAIEQARLSDAGRRAGHVRSAIEGLPVSVKDAFDVAGLPTTAGSTVLADQPAARAHATLVQRLIDAGGILVGRTNMSEFAFSGVGINPHYGSPSCPWDRQTGRIAGGSSSGAGVAVADGMSVISLGTDTGGSVRIPAAFCGVTGFKPTARRLPAQGMVPLSTSLDSSGPLAPSVACCAVADAILSGRPQDTPSEIPSLDGLRLAVPACALADHVESYVQSTFQHALDVLASAGAHIEIIDLPEFNQHAYINRHGGLAAPEAWHWHQPFFADHEKAYDPRVVTRLLCGRDMQAHDYIDVLRARERWIAAVERQLQWHDALLMPTAPILPPPISQLSACDDAYFPSHGAILRHTSLINFLDGCALSIPCHEPGQPPVGLMIAGPSLSDARVLAIGQAIEQQLQAQSP